MAIECADCNAVAEIQPVPLTKLCLGRTALAQLDTLSSPPRKGCLYHPSKEKGPYIPALTPSPAVQI